jgi:TonB family protein
MTDLTENTALPKPSGEGVLAGPPPLREAWTQKKFTVILVVTLVLHMGAIMLLETTKTNVPRLATAVPHLRMVDNTNELIALSDPSLFARPNAHELVTTYWRRLEPPKQPNFNWIEAPGYLPPTNADFGGFYSNFVEHLQAGELTLNFKPEPKTIIPNVILEDDLPPVTTMQISGELAGRRLLTSLELPSLPVNDVLQPSRVQALVDTFGNIASAIILQPTTDSAADQRALQLVRTLRFAPAPHLMFGGITFTWHTVPLPLTNEPSH